MIPIDSPDLALAAAVMAGLVLVVLLMQGAAGRGRLERLRLLAEQSLAAGRGEAETLRATLAATERALMAASATASGWVRATPITL